MKRVLTLVSVIAASAFVTNLIWENVQAPLYAGYTDFSSHFLICLRGVLGDIIIIIALYAILAWWNKDWFWMRNLDLRNSLLVAILGIIVAIYIEINALGAGYWSYEQSMPIIPVLNVGLTPILQMIILPLLSFYIAKLITNKNYAE